MFDAIILSTLKDNDWTSTLISRAEIVAIEAYYKKISDKQIRSCVHLRSGATFLAYQSSNEIMEMIRA